MSKSSSYRSNFLVLIAGTLMAVAGVGLLSPILPAVRAAFGLTDFQASALIWGYLLPGVFLAPFIGYVADRWGRRRVLWISLLVFGVSGGGCVFTSSFQGLLALRFLQGIGGVSLPLMARTLIGDYYGSGAGSFMGYHDAVLSLGGAVFPVLGGWLGSFSWYWPFVVYVLAVPVGLMVLWILPGWNKPSPVKADGYLTEIGDMLWDRRFLFLLGCIFLVFVLKYGFMHTALPFLLEADFEFQSQTIGYFVGGMGLAVAAVSAVYGRLEEKLTQGNLISLGFISYGVGLLATSLGSSLLPITIGIIAAGMGHGILLPAINTAIVQTVNRSLRASAMGLRKIFVRTGQALGSPVLALVGQAWGYKPPLVISGVIIVLAASTYFVAKR